MADLQYVREYFSEHAARWNRGHYSEERWPRVYPIGHERARVALEQMTSRLGGAGGRFVDLGCGGGALVMHAASLGFTACGIDIAEGMIAEARAAAGRARELSPALPVPEFAVGDVLNSGLPSGAFDAVAAVGLVEYLPEDEPFFREAARLLRPGGVLVASLRNRCYNLASLNEYTAQEEQAGTLGELLRELQATESGAAASPDALRAFARRLADVAAELVDALETDLREPAALSPMPEAFGQVRRQHTPTGIAEAARRAGLADARYVGVHPHPLPGSQERHTPRLYNLLASAWEPLGTEPLSLRWSSTIMASFVKA